MEQEYLGDSVYVEIENGMVKLTTINNELPSDSSTSTPSNTIYMEQFVVDAFLGWYKKLNGVNQL